MPIYPQLSGDLNPYPNKVILPGGAFSGIWEDSEFDVAALEPIIDQVTCSWIPDLPSWTVDYTTEGLTQATQSWIAQNTIYLPTALRQLVSWNRDKYINFTGFYDKNAGLGRQRAPKNLVPTAVKLTPLHTAAGYVLPNHWKSRADAINITKCTTGYQFPNVMTDKWRVDVTWSLDEYRNRFNIQYAKVEIEPSIRLESIQGSNIGVIPPDKDGEPDITKAQADKTVINKTTTGFPAREPQLLIKVTYPWVRFYSKEAPSILLDGPLGYWSDARQPAAGVIPSGQYLGCVNSSKFMGFPRGRVLYQSADLTEAVSPVSGRLGYRVTHVFLVLPTASWNMSRYSGEIKDFELPADSLWPYGHIVATNKDGTIKLTLGEPIQPYVHKNLNFLLYYNNPLTGNPVVPFDEG